MTTDEREERVALTALWGALSDNPLPRLDEEDDWRDEDGTRWRAAVGWPGYRVSDRGGVDTLWRPGDRRCLLGFRFRRRKLVPTRRRGGYLLVCLCRGGCRSTPRAHKLVLTAFVGPCPPGHECRHLNGSPADNRVANLEYGTPQQNAQDRERHGTVVRGSAHVDAKLTETDVPAVRFLGRLGARRGYSQKAIGRVFGVCKQAVGKVLTGRSWTHVS